MTERENVRERQRERERVTNPLLERYLAAALFLAIDPAGEMWSVVTESPRFNKAKAFSMVGGEGSSRV